MGVVVDIFTMKCYYAGRFHSKCKASVWCLSVSHILAAAIWQILKQTHHGEHTMQPAHISVILTEG